MPEMLVDPYLLRCPPDGADLGEFEEYVVKLSALRELTSLRWAELRSSAKAFRLLSEHSGFPDWERLEDAIRVGDTPTVQVHDIVALVFEFLSRPAFEDRLSVRDVLADDVRCVPELMLTSRPRAFREEFERSAVLLCVAQVVDQRTPDDLIIVTRDLPDESVELSVESDVVEYDAVTSGTTVPSRVQGLVRTCQSVVGSYLCVDPAALLVTFGAEALKQVVDIAVFRRLKIMGLAREQLYVRQWSHGRHFLSTAGNLGLLSQATLAGRFIDSIVDTLLNHNLQKTHQLREGQGGAEPARKRGNDMAWRRDIDHQLHLHYWETHRGPEFASAAVHNDFAIPYD